MNKPLEDMFAGWEADAQSIAVLAFLSNMIICDESFDDYHGEYLAKPYVNEWINGREKGWVVSMRSKNGSKQINIAFFQHRNSDEIHAVKWMQYSDQPLTVENAKFNGAYKDKYDTSYRVKYGRAEEMAGWIQSELEVFWLNTVDDPEELYIIFGSEYVRTFRDEGIGGLVDHIKQDLEDETMDATIWKTGDTSAEHLIKRITSERRKVFRELTFLTKGEYDLISKFFTRS